MPDDFAGSTSTTGTVAVGGSVTGAIETAYDRDWFAVTLEAGQIVNVALNNTSSLDPYLRIHDANGTQLAFNDDGGPGANSALTFTATSSGTYYISAGGFSTRTGTYELTVTEPSILDPLRWGTQMSDNNISVYFGTAGFSADGFTSEGFNAYERAQFMAAFDLLESITNLQFNIVTTAAAADFRLILDTNEMASGSLGQMNPPGFGGADTGVGVFNGSEWDRSAGGTLERGGQGFYTIVHELLHGLGFAHPHDTGGSSTVMPGVTSPFGDYGDFDLNQGAFTIMSYNPDFEGTGNNLYGNAGGPMALDIALLQELYGANTTHNQGNTVYTLPSTNGSGTFITSIWDAGGVDEIRHTGSSAALIDLRAATLELELGGGGYGSYADGIVGGFTIANGVVIENATGGSGNDTITGNDANNRLIGNAGNDYIVAGAGDDWAEGDAGNDTLIGGQGNDSLLGREGNDVIEGGAGNDQLIGADGNDSLVGGIGNDTFGGGLGNDTFIGGDGNDYGGAGSGRDYIDAGEGDDLFSAGFGLDTIHGGNGNNWLAGSYDADLITAGTGNDQIGGGTGDDTITSGAGNDQIGAGDDNDSVDAGAGNDFLGGGAGNDTLIGGAGNDTLNGGYGNDMLTGGADADLFIFNAFNAAGNTTVTDFQTGIDTLRLVGVGLGSDPFDALTMSNITVGGQNAVLIDYGPHNITLLGLQESDLSSGDFLFT
ncbi:MAG: pre-peptidase C-terminal domain-containing protein [Sulfitobacter sp.]